MLLSAPWHLQLIFINLFVRPLSYSLIEVVKFHNIEQMNLQDATGSVLFSWLSAYRRDHSLTVTLFISAPCGSVTENPVFSFQKRLVLTSSVGYVHLFVFMPEAECFMTALSFIESNISEKSHYASVANSHLLQRQQPVVLSWSPPERCMGVFFFSSFERLMPACLPGVSPEYVAVSCSILTDSCSIFLFSNTSSNQRKSCHSQPL